MAFGASLGGPMGIGQLLLNLPSFFGSIYSMAEGARLSKKWAKDFAPEKYKTSGFGMTAQDYRSLGVEPPDFLLEAERKQKGPVPAATRSSVSDFLAGYSVLPRPTKADTKAALR